MKENVTIKPAVIMSNTLAENSNEWIQLTANQEEGWQDLIFSITEKQLLPDGYWKIVCKALYKENVVGFQFYIFEGIEAGIVNNDIDTTKFVNDAVKIQSIGNESNELLDTMSQLYNQPLKNEFSKEQLNYTIFPLNTVKANLEEGNFKFKIFFDEDNEHGLYCEFYLNTNFPNGTIELNEKGEEYRKNIIHHLGQKD